MEKRHTVCRLCSSVCPIEVYLKDGRLVSAKRKSSLPLEKAYYCSKLKAASEIVYSPQRIKAPLVREESGGKRDWKEISWEEALGIVSRKLNTFKSEYGPQSVCWLRGMAADWGAPWDYAIRFMHAFGSPNVIGNGSVCHVAREMAHFFTYGAMTSSDYKNSKCIFIWGKNDRDTNPPAYEAILYAKKQGAKLIVVDPIKTKLASLADIWLQIRPGCDGVLAMSIMNTIIEEKLYDSNFIQQWTLGFDILRKSAAKYTPENVAKRIWVDKESIKEAARIYAKTKPACLIEGNGLDMHANVSQNTRAVCILRALSGNIDREGGDLLPQPVPTRNIQLKESLKAKIEPISFRYPLFNKFHKTRGDHALSSVMDAILEEKPYPLKALIIQASNPVVTMANSKRFLEAMEKLEFIVVIDLFMTKTAEKADLVLPATTCFEKTQLNLKAFSNPVVLQNQVIDWAENSWPDWKIIFELGKKMGYEKEFPWETVEEAIDYQLEPSGITVEMLRENPEGIFVGEKRYEKYRQEGFNTPSGKIEFYSDVYKKHGYPPLPEFEEYEEDRLSFIQEKDNFPFVAISGARPNNFVHSQFRNIPSLLRESPEPFVDIHPDDAATLEIKDGQMVGVETPNGKISMKAKLSDVVHPGSVRIAWGWGEFDPRYNINDLTDDHLRDPLTGTTSNRCFMCNIVKLAEHP